MDTEVNNESLQTYEGEIPSLLEKAKGLQVKDLESFSIAKSMVDTFRDRKKAFLEFIEPHIDRANKAHKALTRDRARVVNGYDSVINEASKKAIAWQDEQERIRKEAEAKLQAELRKKEEEERLARAVELEKSGDTKKAEEVISEPIETKKVNLPSSMPSGMGLGTRKNWKWKLVNQKEVKPQYLIPDEVKIGQMVRALGKEAEATIGGIEVWQEKGLSGR